MKNIVFYIVFLIISTSHLQAQEFDMGDVMETAMDFVEEAQGGAETQADNQSMGQMVDKLLKKTDDPAFKALIENLSHALKEFENESYTGKCLQVMGAYAEALAYADRRVELAGNACEKKEWLGIEGLLLLTGGTINYCPTEFYGLSDESLDENEQKEIITRYEAEIYIYFFGSYAEDIFRLNQQIDEKKLKELLRDKIVKNNPDMSLGPDELDNAVNIYYDLVIRLQHEYIFDDFKKEDGNFELFETFQKANQQLGLHGINGINHKGAMIDFVGKMFTPEFMLTKTVEIAKLSNLYKCSN